MRNVHAMQLKRRRSSVSSRTPFKKRARAAARRGRTGYANVLRTTVAKVKQLTRTLETKESQYYTSSNVSLPHNNAVMLLGQNGTPLNVFEIYQGSADPMVNHGNRVGDQVNLKGVSIKMFLENALGRAKVHYRIMLVRGAKGETFNRANLFCGACTNKMLDPFNKERFTIISQKFITVSTSNNAPLAVDVVGVPSTTPTPAGIATKMVSMYIPGRKFGKNGVVQYENNSPTQVKFYDYRIVIVAYDWFGTPQDVNNVGRINELFYRVFYKDA